MPKTSHIDTLVNTLFDNLSPTPALWLEQATEHLELLLNDHAACEKKAALFALSLTQLQPQKPDIIKACSKIAREELRHYELIIGWIEKKALTLQTLSPSRYAKSLQSVLPQDTMLHKLLVAAVIEARSCERFAKLAPYLAKHPDLAVFYSKLWQAEQRHAGVYIEWARALFPNSKLEPPLTALLTKDCELISKPDNVFRFHSGPLQT